MVCVEWTRETEKERGGGEKTIMEGDNLTRWRRAPFSSSTELRASGRPTLRNRWRSVVLGRSILMLAVRSCTGRALVARSTRCLELVRPLDVPLNAPFFFFLFFFPISKDINIVFYGALLVLLSFASVPRASPSVLAPEVNSDRSPRFVQFMVHSFD